MLKVLILCGIFIPHHVVLGVFPFAEIIPPAGKISIYKSSGKTELVRVVAEQPGIHGVTDSPESIEGFLYTAVPLNGCEYTNLHLPNPPAGENPPIKIQWIILVQSSSGCDFYRKLNNAAVAGFAAAIVFNVGSNGTEVIPLSDTIPAFSIGEYDGWILMSNEGNDNDNRSTHYHYVRIPQPDLFWGKFRAFGSWISAGLVLLGLGLYLLHLLIRTLDCSVRIGRTCGICRETLPGRDSGSVLARLFVLPCSHKFHAFCMMPYSTPVGMSCPTCSRVFQFDSQSASFEERQQQQRQGSYGGSEVNPNRIMITAAPYAGTSRSSDMLSTSYRERTTVDLHASPRGEEMLSSDSGSTQGLHMNLNSEREPLLIGQNDKGGVVQSSRTRRRSGKE